MCTSNHRSDRASKSLFASRRRHTRFDCDWSSDVCSSDLQIIKRLWAGEQFDFAGKHYRLKGAICRPRPLQSPRPPIMIGGAGEKKMLRLVAQEADIWNASAGNYAQLDHKITVLREHCRTVGRR